MLRYLANSVSTGQQSDSADRRIAQSTRYSDKDAANITKLPGGNSNFNHRRYVNSYEAPGKNLVYMYIALLRMKYGKLQFLKLRCSVVYVSFTL